MTYNNKAHFLAELSRLSKTGFSIGVGFRNGAPSWVHSTYNDLWVDRYVEQGWMAVDPTITHGQKTTGHFTWSRLSELYPDNPVMLGAAEAGMPEGNTLSLCVNGVRAIFSGDGTAWHQAQVQQAVSATSGLAFMFGEQPMPCILAKPEMDVVKLMSEGVKDREIAERLGVKIETIRKRREKAYDLTGTRTQASLLSFVITNCWL